MTIIGPKTPNPGTPKCKMWFTLSTIIFDQAFVSSKNKGPAQVYFISIVRAEQLVAASISVITSQI
jgi:hypothetical protein